ncbi:MAG: spore coat associated protein CotJA [Eubacterium sp.]|nr:spore coat associated protein CotJA [Eubacterium sp.]
MNSDRYSSARSQGQTTGKIESPSLAMAYVFWQDWENLYKPEDGYVQGTVFKQLNKPFTGRRWGK